MPRQGQQEDVDVMITGHHSVVTSRCIDESDALSLNGCLVAAEVLRLVPSAAAFRTALRAVKLWARRRHIEGFALGLAA